MSTGSKRSKGSKVPVPFTGARESGRGWAVAWADGIGFIGGYADAEKEIHSGTFGLRYRRGSSFHPSWHNYRCNGAPLTKTSGFIWVALFSLTL